MVELSVSPLSQVLDAVASGLKKQKNEIQSVDFGEEPVDGEVTFDELGVEDGARLTVVFKLQPAAPVGWKPSHPTASSQKLDAVPQLFNVVMHNDSERYFTLI